MKIKCTACIYNDGTNKYTHELKLNYTHKELLHVSASYVAIIRDIKCKG
jgi:hypothetical protein